MKSNLVENNVVEVVGVCKLLTVLNCSAITCWDKESFLLQMPELFVFIDIGRSLLQHTRAAFEPNSADQDNPQTSDWRL